MKDALFALLVWGLVLGVLLGIVVGLDAAFSGFEYEATCQPAEWPC